tara:strand:- start:181 stop:567 length:387 start_codon:yes stop_codon:yes gene_type:complete
MAKKTSKKDKDRQRVVSGEGVVLPPRPPRTREHAPGLGVTAARRPKPQDERIVRAEDAGAEATMFPAGGKAFAVWLQKEHGINPKHRIPVSEFQGYLEEFAARPLHGHRRGPEGGNHRPNSRHLRGRR